MWSKNSSLNKHVLHPCVLTYNAPIRTFPSQDPRVWYGVITGSRSSTGLTSLSRPSSSSPLMFACIYTKRNGIYATPVHGMHFCTSGASSFLINLVRSHATSRTPSHSSTSSSQRPDACPFKPSPRFHRHPTTSRFPVARTNIIFPPLIFF